MRKTLRMKALESYDSYENKAHDYFTELLSQLKNQSYVSNLKHDFKHWKKHHKINFSTSLFKKNQERKLDKQGYDSYIQSLHSTGKLDNYLERSISYIYMRDLGKALHEKETQDKITTTVDRLKKRLLGSTTKETANEASFFSTAGAYRWGEKEGVELTVIWLFNKLKVIDSVFPEELDAGESKRKLVKLIAGVVIHQLDEFGPHVTKNERAEKLDQAIRIGYAYGLTYPFIDDLLDSDVLTKKEQKTFTSLLRETLLTGTVPVIDQWTGPNQVFIEFVHQELTDAFLYIKEQQTDETMQRFFEVAYVFFEAQEKDRAKDLLNTSYTNEELFIPVILKSAFSRLISRSILPTSRDEGFDARTFYYGIYNQLADDFTDMFSNMKANRVTPYTYYLTHYKNRPDVINPFELYWTVISHLIHNVYQSDPKTIEVILSRAINSQQRFKQRIGADKYKEVMEQLSFGNKTFDRQLQLLVKQTGNVDFLDKLVRDHITQNNHTEEKERRHFLEIADRARKDINQFLPISTSEPTALVTEPIIEAANYSLKNGGKRLRPIMTWFLGVKEYGIDSSAIIPLLKSIEYMHTASLIFDDLPSQDDAPFRRGQPTLHKIYDVAIAELTGLFLTQKAVSEQASLQSFNPEAVLQLIQYSSETITAVARGQAMDLGAKGNNLTIEQLNTICFYKTGISFEASLVMPAILAEKSDTEIQLLKNYVYHAGIAFQIKDDLLDVEGETTSLGKQIGIDFENKTVNFVSVLGVNEAKKVMWEHYCLATEELEKQEHHSSFLKFFLDYIVQREK